MFELNQTLVAAANQAREQRHEIQAPASRLDSVRHVRELIGAHHMLQLPLGLEDIAVHGRHVPGVENQANSRMVDPADQFGGAVGRLQEHAGNGHHRLDPERDFASRSEEHTSELQSLMRNSYAVFCLKKKKK